MITLILSGYIPETQGCTVDDLMKYARIVNTSSRIDLSPGRKFLRRRSHNNLSELEGIRQPEIADSDDANTESDYKDFGFYRKDYAVPDTSVGINENTRLYTIVVQVDDYGLGGESSGTVKTALV